MKSNLNGQYLAAGALMAILLMAFYRAEGQSVLDAYVTEGLQNNAQLVQEALMVQDQEMALAQANGQLMPSVQFLADYTLAGGGRAIDFPVGDLLNPVYSSLNEITESNSFPQIENVNEQFLPNDFHDTRLRLIQPLFNSALYYNRKIKREQVAMAEAKKEAYTQELTKEIKVAYYNYLQAKSAVSIYETNQTALKELVRFNQSRFAEAVVTQDEVYRSEYQLEQLLADQADAKAQVEAAAVYFNFLLNRPYDAAIRVDSTLVIPETQATPSVDQALENRAELQQLKAAMAAQSEAFQLNRSNMFLPTLNLVGDMGYQGFGYSFDADQDYWLVNFSLQWDLFAGSTKKLEAQRSKIQLDMLKSQEDQLQSQIAMEVVRAKVELVAAQKRYTAKTKSLKAAQRTFAITQSRYEASQALLIELLDAQTASLSAQLEQSISKFQWLSSQAQLERAVAYQ